MYSIRRRPGISYQHDRGVGLCGRQPGCTDFKTYAPSKVLDYQLLGELLVQPVPALRSRQRLRSMVVVAPSMVSNAVWDLVFPIEIICPDLHNIYIHSIHSIPFHSILCLHSFHSIPFHLSIPFHSFYSFLLPFINPLRSSPVFKNRSSHLSITLVFNSDGTHIYFINGNIHLRPRQRMCKNDVQYTLYHNGTWRILLEKPDHL